ncbi:TetR family transcriptional regulator [Nocardia sp. CDC159]|uniref:TetR family transcriptional regulator n=1 Tax=Nocardia pulmonis TaxID=2951408 RepID=A0A9X2E2J0_9NOCA|nr:MULTISPECIES: TetR family transcriptional regulator [Nocardia]MCM6772460.1 TetR family transcriptional regulator [Nocardia pulmonis]MCM6784882.1 TetR family transcriptional regulator [Nocardia sp. CDC159]
MNDQQPARRRKPSRRRDQLAAAGEQVIAERGLEGLTHRAVAETAGVPLGSTTYYFADRDDLIAVVLARAIDDHADYLRAWSEQHAGDTLEQVIAALVDTVAARLADHRRHSIVQLELIMAALRRPDLQPMAQRFYDQAIDSLTPHFTDPTTATTAVSVITGYILHGLIRPNPPDRDEITAVLHCAFGLPAPANNQHAHEKSQTP